LFEGGPCRELAGLDTETSAKLFDREAFHLSFTSCAE